MRITELVIFTSSQMLLIHFSITTSELTIKNSFVPNLQCFNIFHGKITNLQLCNWNNIKKKLISSRIKTPKSQKQHTMSHKNTQNSKKNLNSKFQQRKMIVNVLSVTRVRSWGLHLFFLWELCTLKCTGHLCLCSVKTPNPMRMHPCGVSQASTPSRCDS